MYKNFININKSYYYYYLIEILTFYLINKERNKRRVLDYCDLFTVFHMKQNYCWF